MLLRTILEGPNIKDKINESNTQTHAALTIAQLFIFNVVKHVQTQSTGIRHNKDKKTRLATYLGLVIHVQTRKNLIGKPHKFGLCISYDRVIQISSDMGNSVCARYEEEKVVYPPKMRNNILLLVVLTT